MRREFELWRANKNNECIQIDEVGKKRRIAWNSTKAEARIELSLMKRYWISQKRHPYCGGGTADPSVHELALSEDEGSSIKGVYIQQCGYERGMKPVSLCGWRQWEVSSVGWVAYKVRRHVEFVYIEHTATQTQTQNSLLAGYCQPHTHR